MGLVFEGIVYSCLVRGNLSRRIGPVVGDVIKTRKLIVTS